MIKKLAITGWTHGTITLAQKRKISLENKSWKILNYTTELKKEKNVIYKKNKRK